MEGIQKFARSLLVFAEALDKKGKSDYAAELTEGALELLDSQEKIDAAGKMMKLKHPKKKVKIAKAPGKKTNDWTGKEKKAPKPPTSKAPKGPEPTEFDNKETKHDKSMPSK